jgi:cyclo(L-tyrosyl-L-tyrosyl) synthase
MPEKFNPHFVEKGPEEYREEKIEQAVAISAEHGSEAAREFLGADKQFLRSKEIHKIKRTIDKEVDSETKEFGGDLVKEVLTNNQEKKHFDNLVLGISPFNSYFNDANLTKLVNYGLNNYKDLKIFLPDKPAMYSLMAMNYEEKDAQKKTKNQINWLRNKIREAGVKNGLSVQDVNAMIVDSEYLEKNKTYTDLHTKLTEYFQTNPQFANAVRQASWDCFLKAKEENQGKTMGDLPIENLNMAAKYLLAETPIFFKSKEILGTEDSLFAYHQLADYMKKIYKADFANQEFDFVPGPEQGCAVLAEFKKPSNPVSNPE